MRRTFQTICLPLVALAVLLAGGASFNRCTPAQRAAFSSWVSEGRAHAPTPISSLRCPPGPVKDEIRRVFGFASEWAESVAMRESHCTAGAYNASGASGIMQLLGHEDLVAAVCPGRDPMVARFAIDCNVRAAYRLYQSSGTSPWRL